jgi:4-hydroxy-3-methylbut-2-en-1-yl diphosphate reductase
MKVILANPRGFCAGVEMAIQTVEQAVKIVGTPLYVYHEIVHNRHVVDHFVQEGVIFVDSINDVPENATVVFSAHGVSPQIRNDAKQRGCTMIDATCPLVTKVHMEALRYARQGYNILLIGHAGHDEVVGTVGEAPGAITIVESPQDVAALPFGPDDMIAYLTQTTLSVDDADRIIGAIRKHYPQVKEPPTEDICYATTNRQRAVRELSPKAGLVLVVGSQNSSNSVRLTEIAEHAAPPDVPPEAPGSKGPPAKLIDDASELDPAWFVGIDSVLVTAGASAPEHLVQQIVQKLVDDHHGTVEHATIVEEDMSFNLPMSLRVLAGNTSGLR